SPVVLPLWHFLLIVRSGSAASRSGSSPSVWRAARSCKATKQPTTDCEQSRIACGKSLRQRPLEAMTVTYDRKDVYSRDLPPNVLSKTRIDAGAEGSRRVSLTILA